MLTRLLSPILILSVLLCAGLTLVPMQEKGVITLEFIGAFHPLILHLPIGLWVGVLLLLFWQSLGHSVKPFLFWGAAFTVLSGVAAFLTGLNLYWAGSYGKETLTPHMYGALVFLIGVVIFSLLCKAEKGIIPLWITAAVSMAALGAAGHVGGVITHGEPMDKAPWVVAAKKKEEALRKAAEAEANDESIKNPLVFNHVVLPILEEKCVSCHSSERAKGKLRMDSYAALIKGGSKGASLIPGDVAETLMIARAHLPLDNKEHMPPKEKPQLTPEELSFLEWWVRTGAKEKEFITDVSIPEEHSALVNSFIGGDPETIKRRKKKEQAEELLKIQEEISRAFPGVITQSIQGESTFELNSASLYDVDEEHLRTLLKPLMPHVVRLDWHNREVNAEWFTLLKESHNLEIINLNQAKITEEQLKTLITQNLPIEKLNLYGVPVTDALVPTLAAPLKTGALSTLIISETKLSAEGKATLRASIPNTTIIDAH